MEALWTHRWPCEQQRVQPALELAGAKMNLAVVHIDNGSMSERRPDLVVGAALHVVTSFANANRPLIYFASSEPVKL